MIYKRGKNGIYSYRFRFAGRMIHESARTHSKTLARDAERVRRRELEKTFNKVEKRELPPTVGQASRDWLEKRAGLAASTRETYKAALKHVSARLGAMLVCDIEAQDIAAYQRARLAESAAGASINKELACLASILSDRGAWERVRRDVARLPENEEAGRVLSAEEEKALLEQASLAGEHQGGWTPVYTVTVLGLNAGMRHKEIRTLRWKHLNLEARVLRVAESKTKAGEGRAITLTQPAWAALTMWASRFPNRKPEQFVFPACENGQVDATRHISNWRTAWTRTTKNAGLLGLRFHDLRHSTATKLLEQGTPFAVVADILGWAASTAVRMAKRYGHIRPEAQRRALEGVATPEIQTPVHQIVHQVQNAVECELPN